MKQKVKLSSYSIILSAVCLTVLFVSVYYCRDNWGCYAIGAAVVVWLILALCYMPLSISVDGQNLKINRSLKIKKIPFAEIRSVQLCQPTMAEHRIFGSGGWFGYWGWFKEPSIGKYFAYYGKASDCFLVTLKNGKKYLLGCENAPSMVNSVCSSLK